MKINRIRNLFLLLGTIMIVLNSFSSIVDASEANIIGINKKSSISLKKEVQHAIGKGLDWLKKNQKKEGYWSQAEYPALTSLVLTAFMGDPSKKYNIKEQKFIQKGYDYVKSCIKPDGGIYVNGLANYNTAVSIMAFKSSRNPEYADIIKKARNFIVSLQYKADKESGDALNGGIGYSHPDKRPDLSNTMMALEAIYYTKFLKDADKQVEEFKELNWKAVVEFIQNCQNLPEYNKQSWVASDKKNKGGFIYAPGESKAGKTESTSNETALRSYGSISYVGLLSYIYADMKHDDPRVKAVFNWLKQNYTLEENPGMGKQGLYYYYHTMAKALSLYHVADLEIEKGRTVDWRHDLALKLFNHQKPEGHWINENGRFWERDPVLVTSYAVIILEIIYNGL